MNDNKQTNVLDIQAMRNVGAMKKAALVLSLIVYTSVVIYAEYHFWQLVSRYVANGFQIVGLVAVAASAVTAFALPLALHFWFRSGMQKLTGFAFYGLHFLVMVFNLVLDSNLAVASNIPTWIADIYGVWFLPGYIVLYAVGWSALWFLDEDSQTIDKVREVAMAEREAELNRKLAVANAKDTAIEQAFQSPGAKAAINRWAARVAPGLLAAEMGLTLDELSPETDFKFWLPEEGDGKPVAKPTTPPAPVKTPIMRRSHTGAFRPSAARGFQRNGAAERPSEDESGSRPTGTGPYKQPPFE